MVIGFAEGVLASAEEVGSVILVAISVPTFTAGELVLALPQPDNAINAAVSTVRLAMFFMT